ncbi:hypothetical protein CSOJ01_05377 [Colletotrichum sojae]|uniref:F-box domain-containing protein n=1 Tax=Colletotrichum sojae TaxID=2175907 RepID=A0A8H6MWS0_9PEZI|nr:hypothetical protein CSOJ01_05377 [Colletotrichum sojae]
MSGHDTPHSKASPAFPNSAPSKSLLPPSSTVNDLCRGILRRRDDNAKNSRLYQLPTEMFLGIMSHLGPVELYVARQRCVLFMRAFEVRDFSDFHRYVAGDRIRQDLEQPRRYLVFPLRDVGYSAIHQRFRASEARYEPAPAGAFRPIVELDRGWVSEAEEREIARLVRRDFLCQSCLATPLSSEAPELRWPGNDTEDWNRRLSCVKCAAWHRTVFFSDTQLAKKCHQMFKLFKGKKAVPLPCAECEVLFRADRGEKCSTLVASGDIGSVGLRIMVEWTMEVCHLAEGQVVTKELIRQGLEGLEARFGNRFLCPHLTFRGQKLMVPFEVGTLRVLPRPDARPKPRVLPARAQLPGRGSHLLRVSCTKASRGGGEVHGTEEIRQIRAGFRARYCLPSLPFALSMGGPGRQHHHLYIPFLWQDLHSSED